MTKALAWPVAAIVILILCRRALPTLIDRLRSLRYGKFEAAFEKETVRVAENISTEPNRSLAATSEHTDEQLIALANVSPRAAIIEAWSRIEARLRDLAPDTDSRRRPVSEIVRRLREEQKINDVTEDSLRGLMQLRNLAVHAPERELSVQKAVDFITLAGAILWVLQRPR